MQLCLSVGLLLHIFIFTFRVRVRVKVGGQVRDSVRLRYHPANKVPVRCVNRYGE